MAIKTLQDWRQKCFVKVRVNGEEKTAHVLFQPGYNDRPVGERIYLHPLGWFATNEVELIEVLDWVEPVNV